MNIFYLDRDLETCARYHCDKHVVKMITEYAQLLAAPYYFHNYGKLPPFGLTHANHPCSLWARESLQNWCWLAQLGLYLYKEYQFRYGKTVHKSGLAICWMIENIPPLPDKEWTEPPLCLPSDVKNENNKVASYRAYYVKYKSHLLKWRKREVPKWALLRSLDET